MLRSLFQKIANLIMLPRFCQTLSLPECAFPECIATSTTSLLVFKSADLCTLPKETDLMPMQSVQISHKFHFSPTLDLQSKISEWELCSNWTLFRVTEQRLGSDGICVDSDKCNWTSFDAWVEISSFQPEGFAFISRLNYLRCIQDFMKILYFELSFISLHRHKRLTLWLQFSFLCLLFYSISLKVLVSVKVSAGALHRMVIVLACEKEGTVVKQDWMWSAARALPHLS